MEERGEQNGQMEVQRRQRACLRFCRFVPVPYTLGLSSPRNPAQGTGDGRWPTWLRWENLVLCWLCSQLPSIFGPQFPNLENEDERMRKPVAQVPPAPTVWVSLGLQSPRRGQTRLKPGPQIQAMVPCQGNILAVSWVRHLGKGSQVGSWKPCSCLR